MVATELVRETWDQGLAYDAYVATGTPEQQRRWAAFHSAVHLTEGQRALLAGFVRPMRVLVVSGVWCGDCVEQVPFLDYIARATGGKVEVRVVDRDVHKGLSGQLRICGGDRVPVALLLSEDFDFLGLVGDRTLSRYRAKALKELAAAEGASCSTGLVVPVGEQMAATLQDWVDEVERAELMLRLSPRYRQKYLD